MLEQAFQLREFYSLSELQAEWNVHPDTISQWLARGRMKACVWLPLRSVYRLSGSCRELDHFEGYALIEPHVFRRLMRQGFVELRDLESMKGTEVYAVPDSCDGLFVKRDDCVVLAEEKDRFEKALPATNLVHTPNDSGLPDPNFKYFQHQGQSHTLGDLQAAFLQQLYQAARTQDPWLQGKQVLGKIGSRSFRVADLFRHQPRWRDWIESDGRGGYRLYPDFLRNFKVE